MTEYRQLYRDAMPERLVEVLARQASRSDLVLEMVRGAIEVYGRVSIAPGDVLAGAWALEQCEYLAAGARITVGGCHGEVICRILARKNMDALLRRDAAPGGRASKRVLSLGELSRMRSLDRRTTIRNLRDEVAPGGRLLLSVDLMKSSDFLWTEVERREIETPLNHGTIADFGHLLSESGLRCADRKILRNLPNGRCDILLLTVVSGGSQ